MSKISKQQDAQPFIRLIDCPSGECFLGSDEHHANEKPRHKIKLSYAFQIAQTPVTQSQWMQLMPSNPSHFLGDLHPVDSVTWLDCIEFCNRLSQREGLEICYKISDQKVLWHRSANGYRLPTEAEWAYAAYANESVIYAGQEPLRKIAWFGENEFLDEQAPQTHEVMLKAPNAWGIYDMSGNVWEWCHDQFSLFDQSRNEADRRSIAIENPVYWSDDLQCNRVLKGGCYWNLPKSCRISSRSQDEAKVTHDGRGFRIVRGVMGN